MGLPMWSAPPPEASSTLKTDPTAPARSPIRRRRSLPRSRPSRYPASPRLREYSDRRIALPRLERETYFSEAAERLANENAHLPPPVPESRHYSRHPLARYTSVFGSHADEEAPAPAPPLVIDVSRGLGDRLRPLPALTPEFAPAAASRNARRDAAHLRELAVRRSRSPFSRLRDVDQLADPNRTLGRIVNRRNFSDDDGDGDGDGDGDDDGGDNTAVGFPPLRRMGRRTIADGPLPSSSLRGSWSPAGTLDGLGDRDRSLSPVENQWETMDTSVAPDPLPPTADSSFTSAAASASFSNSHPSSRAGSSNSNSAASSRTHLTVPSRRNSLGNELFMAACESSADSASDTEEEDIHTHTQPSLRRSTARHGSSFEPPSRNPLRYSRSVRERSRESSAYVHSFYGEVIAHEPRPRPRRPANDQVDGPALERDMAAEDMPLDQELRDARALLERLARRDDISDEFWASVGLRRPLADRVERLQERERL